MPSPPEQSNSILNLLNPYASVSRSTARLPDPDSPSTLLLRELSGHPSTEFGPAEEEEEEEENDRPGEGLFKSSSRFRHLSPTPTPATRRPSHVISNSSSSEDEGPPRSILYGEPSPEKARLSGERTPRSPPVAMPRSRSPGPFHAPSSSTSEGRSRSTSPGPSTISVYASGLEGTALNSSIHTSSRDPSTSPDLPKASSSKLTPTFREPPRPAHPPRAVSGSSTKKASPKLGSGSGYLDPKLPFGKDRKGKGKSKVSGGRKYAPVPTEPGAEVDGEDETVEAGRYAGFGISKRKRIKAKAGLDEYERALWNWVNVEDLDGFLQEVSWHGIALAELIIRCMRITKEKAYTA